MIFSCRRKSLAYLSLWLIAAVNLFSSTPSAQTGANSLEELRAGFIAPPAAARPWVYWMWLSSNVTRAGISADLEAMQRVGIGGALIMDVEQGTPDGPMQFLDSQWQEMFGFAVSEAKRLGLQLAINDGDGYYGSGGPWIPPELGMQSLFASETYVVGDRPFSGKLRRPHVPTDDPPEKPEWAKVQPRRRFPPGADYRDVAVLAIPSLPSDHASMSEASPRFSQSEQTRAAPTEKQPLVLTNDAREIVISFPQPYTAGVLEVNFEKRETSVQLVLEARDDRGWKTIKSFAAGPCDWRSRSFTFSFEPVQTREFRIRLDRNAQTDTRVALTACELHRRYRIDDPMRTKLLGWHGWIGYAGGESAPLTATLPAAAAVAHDRMINLTARMRSDGQLDWTPPEGQWTILRIGHAFTGSMIGPTPENTAGPESDKLSAQATALHLNTVLSLLGRAVAAADRDAWTTVHIDSWEGGGQNWTPHLRDEFIKRRGYDPLPYLPVALGRIVDDLQTSERFLWDLRKTVSELMVENYAAVVQRIARQNHLRFSFESYTTIGNDLDAANFADEPIAEFWPHRPDDGFRSTNKAMASAAHLNGRTIIGAESFDADQKERWLEHPATLKPFADELLTTGVNHIIVHRYAMQPFLHVAPGVQMGPWGQHYERTQTWWESTGPWHRYLARCQFLLRTGHPTADILRLQPEEPLHRFVGTTFDGYDYDACSPDTFAQLRVENGEWVSRGGNYKLLVLDHADTMTLPLLTHLRDEVRAGGCVWGEPPKQTPGLTDRTKADARLIDLVREIWGEQSVAVHACGRGRVFRQMTVEAALRHLEIEPDFSSDQPLHWIHRHGDADTEIYFLANTSQHDVEANCTFRVHDLMAERWDAEAGTFVPISSEALDKQRSRLIISLAAESSAFLIFRPKDKDSTAQRPLSVSAVHPHLVKTITINEPWIVRFPPGWGAPEKIRIDHLAAWNESSVEGIGHFSGTARYGTQIELTAADLDSASQIQLDLGRVEMLARIKVNGRSFEPLWRHPFKINIISALRAGKNEIEVKVTNLWVNRLIGDESLPEDSARYSDGTLQSWPAWLSASGQSPSGRFTFSSWRQWKKDEPLRPSGLLGPVTLQIISDK